MLDPHSDTLSFLKLSFIDKVPALSFLDAEVVLSFLEKEGLFDDAIVLSLTSDLADVNNSWDIPERVLNRFIEIVLDYTVALSDETKTQIFVESFNKKEDILLPDYINKAIEKAITVDISGSSGFDLLKQIKGVVESFESGILDRDRGALFQPLVESQMNTKEGIEFCLFPHYELPEFVAVINRLYHLK